MLIHFFFLIGVKSFEEKNFDLDLTEMTADIESGTTKRVRRAFAHGTITTGHGYKTKLYSKFNTVEYDSVI